uniref:PHD-type domain-containing protein n=1 Tax=Mucochytrium quahogii TaxID=96639 RepID=A0A7S2RX79_9STRA|mmetsp:Transcript_25447/g.41042  ORF Transcript_25447/g.41042 Transcript_25447/m.41042 type:complete len:513 (+) Transcript_25447:297-1835(+)|eukprot:CAMPEP_0203761268 /NCGR_PEP_ID=MMETSP0098-20131031/14387_1 /ASSEMBLY_ACC=CAM_ASM_000208 /TAXON_ID=96639 /ORGANISM=" , Strain NY0313808BC1" /LENGTH=512 /DNA_ID=CAMNT_0050655179 /DNA_START=293 /DNA_END=1831 /DNA_ORIENTATION=+
MLYGLVPPGSALPSHVTVVKREAESSVLKTAQSSDGKEADKEQAVKIDLSHLLGFEFVRCPEFRKRDFELMSKTLEENEMAKKLAAGKLNNNLESLFFTKAQDVALVKGVAQFTHGDLGMILEQYSDVFSGVAIEQLKMRWKVLMEGLDPAEDLVVQPGPFGEHIILKFEEPAAIDKRSAVYAVGSVDNDDFCQECAAGGELLCCDTCVRSFHLACLGLEEEPSEEEWSCHYCLENAKDIIDDSDLTETHWKEYAETFNNISTAKATTKGDLEGILAEGGEDGYVTQAFKRVIQAPDKNFEKITREIEAQKGFVSESILSAEKKVLNKFVEKEFQEVRDRADEAKQNKLQKKEGPAEEEGDDVDKEDDEEEEEEEEADEEEIVSVIDEEDEEENEDSMDISDEDENISTLSPSPVPTVIVKTTGSPVPESKPINTLFTRRVSPTKLTGGPVNTLVPRSKVNTLVARSKSPEKINTLQPRSKPINTLQPRSKSDDAANKRKREADQVDTPSKK